MILVPNSYFERNEDGLMEGTSGQGRAERVCKLKKGEIL